MDYPAEGVRFLHIAYAVIAAAQVAYALWIWRQWRSSRGSQTGEDR